MPENIPQRIKNRRKALALSQTDLAEACDVGQSTVANWERGGHIPRQATLHKIAKALEIDQAWLLSGQQASARGPVNRYLSKPIRHIAIFEWPQSKEDFSAAMPRDYVSLSTEQEDAFGLQLAQDMAGFTAGTILAFTRSYDKAQRGVFLNVSETGCVLSETPSESCEARLIYSLTAH